MLSPRGCYTPSQYSLSCMAVVEGVMGHLRGWIGLAHSPVDHKLCCFDDSSRSDLFITMKAPTEEHLARQIILTRIISAYDIIHFMQYWLVWYYSNSYSIVRIILSAGTVVRVILLCALVWGRTVSSWHMMWIVWHDIFRVIFCEIIPTSTVKRQI